MNISDTFEITAGTFLRSGPLRQVITIMSEEGKQVSIPTVLQLVISLLETQIKEGPPYAADRSAARELCKDALAKLEPAQTDGLIPT